MAVQTASVVAGTSATLLIDNTGNHTWRVIFTTHNNSADVYIGGPTVTPTGNGITMPKSNSYTIDLLAGETLYCAGNGTDTVKYLTFV